MAKGQMNRRELLKRGVMGGIGLAGLGAFIDSYDLGTAFARNAAAGIDPAIVSAGKADGKLNVITLPRNWANYGELMDTFSSRYSIKITDAIPDGSSAQEISAIKSLKGLSRAPDVLDVSPAWAADGVKEKLFTPYKVSTWDTIPADQKEPTGLWTGDYYGVPAFMSVNSVVSKAPKDWPDLLNPAFKGMVALGGDPRQAGEAFGAVFAAALANGGSLDNIAPGIDFFAQLKKIGNFNPAFALPAAVAKGTTPIAIRWDYLLLAARDGFNGNPAVTVTIPKTGGYAGYYCQALSKYGPNLDAAKLWLEYLYSDEGQLGWLKGYTHPIRYNDLAKRKVIPAALAAKLPPSSAYKNVKFATAAQIAKAQDLLAAQWGPKVTGS